MKSGVSTTSRGRRLRRRPSGERGRKFIAAAARHEIKRALLAVENFSQEAIFFARPKPFTCSKTSESDAN
jgi:hypothetical protein